ncbi:MAG: DeoR/GlpR family DNA-binding transcription regulator [Victivallaceae bacterium]|nr:DeoR/GlpR family DNA-binding transcription regulator [Victivallaceae bacterium]
MSDVKRKLLSPERENMILQALGEGIQTITELSEKLNVSEATVRRDLQSLELQGKAKRVHGGAVRTKFPRIEPLFNEKAGFQAEEKQIIADKALDFIDDDDTIYLDGGSTVLGLAKKLGGKKNLTIVTNSLMAAAELMESGHQLIMIGGEFRPLSRTVVGPLTARLIEPLAISKAFMGTIGFSLEDGISTTAPNEAYTKELVMRKAAKVIVLADSSKIGTPSLVTSGSLDDIDVLITDPGISAKAIKELQKKKIEVVF